MALVPCVRTPSALRPRLSLSFSLMGMDSYGYCNYLPGMGGGLLKSFLLLTIFVVVGLTLFVASRLSRYFFRFIRGHTFRKGHGASG